MKTSITAIAAAVTLAALPAIAQGPGGFGPGTGAGMRGGAGHGFGSRAGCIMQTLDLDDTQQSAWQDIQSKLHETLQGLAQQRRDLARQRREALAAANPDAEAIGRLAISEHELGVKMRAARDEARSDFAAVLRPDQLQKFQELSELRQACGGRGGFMGRGGWRDHRGPGDCPGCPFGSPSPDGPTSN